MNATMNINLNCFSQHWLIELELSFSQCHPNVEILLAFKHTQYITRFVYNSNITNIFYNFAFSINTFVFNKNAIIKMSWLIIGLGNAVKNITERVIISVKKLLNPFDYNIKDDTNDGKNDKKAYDKSDKKVYTFVPPTSVNECGPSILSVVKKLEISPAERLIVVFDDLSLPLGKIRVRKDSKSHGGHNGVKCNELHRNKIHPSQGGHRW